MALQQGKGQPQEEDFAVSVSGCRSSERRLLNPTELQGPEMAEVGRQCGRKSSKCASSQQVGFGVGRYCITTRSACCC